MKSVPSLLFFKPMKKEPHAGVTSIEWVDGIIVGANVSVQSGYAMLRNGIVESEVLKPPYLPGEEGEKA